MMMKMMKMMLEVFQDLEEEEELKMNESNRRSQSEEELLVVNCKVKTLEDWTFGQSDILQIKLETA